MIDIPIIGDKVEFIDKRYKGLQMIVSAVKCKRVAVQRKDSSNRIWTVYADISEIRRLKNDAKDENNDLRRISKLRK